MKINSAITPTTRQNCQPRISIPLSVIVSMTVNMMFQKTIDLEKAKIAESEKTQRGHWLWGTKSEDIIEETRIVEDGKSERGHWLWGNWDSVAEPTREHSTTKEAE